jgi:hypothetical protein
MKTLEELINKEDSGWDLVKEWLASAKNQYEILPKDTKRAEMELLNAQITTRSAMGAVIYETGGILIDYGWIRILGSGSPQLDRGLMEWNKGKTFENYGEQPNNLLVADDVIGGYFAINSGTLGDEIGKIYYLAQDTLKWESLGCGYSDFLNWTFNGNIQKFYELFKWKTWKEDVEEISGSQTFSFVPFLWTKYNNIEELDRKIIPTKESYELTVEFSNKI